MSFVRFRPGWDCHGLPIEQKALINGRHLDTITLRSACQRVAEGAIARQAAEMKQWGLLANYRHPIRTMDPAYEAAELRVFSKFVERNLVHVNKRPVFWSPSSRTALAEAELEYVDEHVSTACHVKFPIVGRPDEYLLIWTTTPWTIPANQAIAINPTISYIRVHHGDHGYIVAECRLPYLREELPGPWEVEGNVCADELLALKYESIIDGRHQDIITADFVTADTGTGLVHLSPAYGQEDFAACKRHGINTLLELVNHTGDYNDHAPMELVGKSVIGEGIQAVVEYIANRGYLVKCSDHQHRYPYDWRSRKPVIQMATRQWFICTDPIMNELQQALNTVEFIPESGRKRFNNMLVMRKEWCISRQRNWGVPLPVFYERSTESPILDPYIIRHVANLVEQHGTGIWWRASEEELLPVEYKNRATELQKGTDTLDVWFDSGSFWSTTPDHQADAYIEGSDQYRGWFQSSFVTSVVARGQAPCKKFIAHGFVLDEKGNKMSKSRGNVISPADIIKGTEMTPRGTDVLRLWAISSNFLCDVHVGSEVLRRTTEFHQKLRNTFRFILGNLDNFTNPLCGEQLQLIDQCFISKFTLMAKNVKGYCNKYDFANALGILQKFVQVEMSAQYFDIIKNRLYIESTDSASRKSAQTVLLYVARELLSILRPMAPYLCAEVHSHQPTIELRPLNLAQGIGDKSQQFDSVFALRSEILVELHRLQNEKLLESSYQANLCLDHDTFFSNDALAEILMVNSVNHPSMMGQKAVAQFSIKNDTKVTVYRSMDSRCPRCWIFRMSNDDEEVCSPCQQVLQTLIRNE